MPVATNAWRNPLVPVACGQQLHIQSSRSSPDAAHLFSRVGRLGGQALLARFHIIQGARLMYLSTFCQRNINISLTVLVSWTPQAPDVVTLFPHFSNQKSIFFIRSCCLDAASTRPIGPNTYFSNENASFFFGFLLESKSKK